MKESIPADVLADMEYAVQLHMTGQQDPEFTTRIQAEADKIREEIRQKHGVLEIGVPAIRELRE
ncbi:MAG: hypothetical protein KY475_07540 [Planctomycetes bacterium]|nr:hypothetical protein [Planctomycetota bacterium]